MNLPDAPQTALLTLLAIGVGLGVIEIFSKLSDWVYSEFEDSCGPPESHKQDFTFSDVDEDGHKPND